MGDPRLAKLSTRVYGWLLRLYPASFREEYGREMLLTFSAQCRTTYRQQALFGVVELWCRTILDVTTNACGERLTMFRHRETRTRFLLLASGDIALFLSWVLVLWIMGFAGVLLFDAWDYAPRGTLASSIAYFFGRPPGLFIPGALLLLLQLRCLVINWRHVVSKSRLVWGFAISNLLFSICMMGVSVWSGKVTQWLFPQFTWEIGGGYIRTEFGIVIAAVFILALIAIQFRLASSRPVRLPEMIRDEQ